jgi:F0F1-type ATP synthase alpha subunit
MKKIILSAILFLGISTIGFSQERPQKEQRSPEERAQKMTDALDKKLSLNASQKAEIYKIYLERAQTMHKMRAEKKKADMTEMKAKFEANENKILSILDEKQKVTYNQLKAERKEKAHKWHGKHKRDSVEKKP